MLACKGSKEVVVSMYTDSSNDKLLSKIFSPCFRANTSMEAHDYYQMLQSYYTLETVRLFTLIALTSCYLLTKQQINRLNIKAKLTFLFFTYEIQKILFTKIYYSINLQIIT